MAMFSIPKASRDETRYNRKLRIGYGALLLVLLITAVVSSFGDRLSAQVANAFADVGWAVLAISLVSAFTIPYKMVSLRLRKDVRFETTDTGLTRHLVNWSDKYIAFAEITRIHESQQYLQVRGKDQYSWITIPREVENYAVLRGQLERYCPITDSKGAAFPLDIFFIAPFYRIMLDLLRVNRFNGGEMGWRHRAASFGKAVLLDQSLVLATSLSDGRLVGVSGSMARMRMVCSSPTELSMSRCPDSSMTDTTV